MITIYHNNRCSKSRKCLKLIKNNFENYKVIEYLKVEININFIKKIVLGFNGYTRDLIRSDEKVVNGFKINFNNKICLQRLIIYYNKIYILCSPPEKILNYLEK